MVRTDPPMMLRRRPIASDRYGAERAADQRGRGEHHRVAERIGDGEPLPQEELRQENHETEDQRIDGDQRPAADHHALQHRRLEHRRGGKLRHRRRDCRRRQRAGACCDVVFDALHQRFGFRAAALRLEPARRFRQLLAQIPDDQRADTGDHEHRSPAPGRDDQIAEDRGHREAAHHDERHEGQPAPARCRRHEFGQRRIADHDFGAEPETLDEAADDELRHVLSEGSRQRGKPEDQQVDLVGEAPAVFVADKPGDQRAERHADEGQRQELQFCGSVENLVWIVAASTPPAT